jgi:hypothetical protein
MQTLVAEILAAWRRAERLADDLPPGREQDAAEHACDRLRELYHELTGGRGVAQELSDADARKLVTDALESFGTG